MAPLRKSTAVACVLDWNDCYLPQNIDEVPFLFTWWNKIRLYDLQARIREITFPFYYSCLPIATIVLFVKTHNISGLFSSSWIFLMDQRYISIFRSHFHVLLFDVALPSRAELAWTQSLNTCLRTIMKWVRVFACRHILYARVSTPLISVTSCSEQPSMMNIRVFHWQTSWPHVW